jgi:hypothetical protein
MTKKKLKYIIDRAKWGRGDYLHLSEMLLAIGDRADGGQEEAMCCLGQCLLQDGFERKRLLGRGSPNDIQWSYDQSKFSPTARYAKPSLFFKLEKEESKLKAFNLVDTALSNAAMKINDDPLMSDKTREKKLIELFAQAGVDLSFKGEYFRGEIFG